MEFHDNERGVSNVLVGILIVVLTTAIAGGGTYLYQEERYAGEEIVNNNTTTTVTTKSSTVETESDYKEYSDEESGVSFKYPSSWVATKQVGSPEGYGFGPISFLLAEQSENGNYANPKGLEVTYYYATEDRRKFLNDIKENDVKNFGNPSQVKLGDITWERYPVQPGMTASVVPYRYLDGTHYVVVNWEKETVAKEKVTETVLKDILASFTISN